MDPKLPLDVSVAIGIIAVLVVGPIIISSPIAFVAVMVVAAIYGAYETGK